MTSNCLVIYGLQDYLEGQSGDATAATPDLRKCLYLDSCWMFKRAGRRKSTELVIYRGSRIVMAWLIGRPKSGYVLWKNNDNRNLITVEELSKILHILTVSLFSHIYISLICRITIKSLVLFHGKMYILRRFFVSLILNDKFPPTKHNIQFNIKSSTPWLHAVLNSPGNYPSRIPRRDPFGVSETEWKWRTLLHLPTYNRNVCHTTRHQFHGYVPAICKPIIDTPHDYCMLLIRVYIWWDIGRQATTLGAHQGTIEERGGEWNSVICDLA